MDQGNSIASHASGGQKKYYDIPVHTNLFPFFTFSFHWNRMNRDQEWQIRPLSDLIIMWLGTLPEWIIYQDLKFVISHVFILVKSSLLLMFTLCTPLPQDVDVEMGFHGERKQSSLNIIYLCIVSAWTFPGYWDENKDCNNRENSGIVKGMDMDIQTCTWWSFGGRGGTKANNILLDIWLFV